MKFEELKPLADTEYKMLDDDIIFFMNDDDNFYRRYYYPMILKIKAERNDPSFNYKKVVAPVLNKGMNEYCRRFEEVEVEKVKEYVDTKDLMKKIYDKECGQIEQGKYDS